MEAIMIESEAYKKVWKEKKSNPSWKVNPKYMYIAGNEYRKDCDLTPCEIVKQFMEKGNTGTLDKLYTVCKQGLGSTDLFQYQSIGPFECLQVWHSSNKGEPGFKVEVVLDTRSRELSVYQSKGE